MSDDFPRHFFQFKTLPRWKRALFAFLPSVEHEEDGYRVVCKRWRGTLIVWEIHVPEEPPTDADGVEEEQG